MKTRNELNAMTVDKLRTYCRENKDAHNLTGVEIISLQKDKLINALTGQRSFDDLDNRNPAPEPKKTGGNNGDNLAEIIANAVLGKLDLNPALDVEKVNALIDEKVDEKVFEINDKFLTLNSMIDEKLQDLKLPVELKNIETGEIKNLGMQHEKFQDVLNMANCRINVNMVGAAGSGKTFMAEAIAKALDLEFYAISVGLQTSKSDLIGYMDANGNYISTLLRKAFEFGGVFLIDEIDAGNPNVLTVINAMTSNSVAAFPDGMVRKHKDFIILAAANTYGRGGDRQYVGRNPLDGATLDRFAVIDVDIDEKLETALSSNIIWCQRVQKIRKAIDDLKEKLICSPRATINGGIAIENGMSQEDAENAFIFRGINNDIKQRILERM